MSVSTYQLTKDSIKYAISSFHTIIIFGIILCIISIIEHNNETMPFSLSVIMGIIGIILAFVESGFSYRIYSESIKNSKKAPNFKNIKELLHHGLSDVFVTIILAVISVILTKGFLEFLNIEPKLTLINIILIIYILIIDNILSVLWFISLLNLAYHKGKLKAAFNIKEIFGHMKNMGIKKIIFIFIISYIMDFLLSLNVIQVKSHTWNVNITILIINLLITPTFVIFLKRFVARAAFSERLMN